MSNEETFDDFKAPETSYVTAEIGSILKKELSEVETYKDNLDEQLEMSEHPSDTLTEITVEYIQNIGDVNQVNICNYRTKNGVGLDAWGFSGDEDFTTIDLFLTVYVNPKDGNSISATELEKRFNWLHRFYEQSLSGIIFAKIDNKKDELFQVATLIKESNNINRIRLYLLTNAIAPSSFEKDDLELEDETVCEFHVWDAKRLMQQEKIFNGKDPIVVNFDGDHNCVLPCVKIPDVSDNVQCYLTYIPGIVLAAVYNKYHQQILEMNVRTFLQFKGASNQGIRDTLIGHKATPAELRKGKTDKEAEPDMFFAYNNGISATASGVSLNEEQNAITKITDWQIVNGGQTTAAISAVMRMRDVDLKSMARVYVPMKISVVKNKEMVSIVVPKISKYANTQSSVKKSDFNINETFLVELEQRSREEWVVNNVDKPVSKWFFERTRGQYLDKAKKNQTSKAEREFYAEYPKEQMFDKTYLSKFMMAWDQNPAMVCKGGENNYEQFFKKAKSEDIHFDTTRYHRTVAKAILFKAIDAFYGKDGLNVPGYKSNLVAYTMALISYASNKAIDLDSIWKEQCVITQSVYNEMTVSIYSVYAKLINGAEHITYKIKDTYTDGTGKRRNRFIGCEIPKEDLDKIRSTKLFGVLQYIKTVQPVIYNHIINVNEGENINEWTKKSLCWDALKSKIEQDTEKFSFPKELISESGNLDVEVTEGQMKVINEAAGFSSATLFNLNAWSRDNPGKLNPREQAFVGQTAFLAKRGNKLTYKQAKWLLDIIEKAENKGWSDQLV